MGFKRDRQTAPATGGFKRDSQAPGGQTPQGEVGWLTPVDDVMRIAADSMTRGYADKLMGPQEQQHTQRARERTPDWVEAPTDIASAVIASPYRVGSTAAGGLWGGLEGMASAYGHQQDWTPDVGNILWEGGKGALAGAGGAELGKWVGRGWNRMFPEAPVQGPSLPQAEPQLSKVGKVVHAAAEQPLSTTVPIDVALHTFGLPPLASGGAKAAKVAAPLFKPTAPATGPVQPESQAAAALRDYFAKMLAGYGRSQ